MSNIEISKELLEEFYINQNLSLNDVADYFGIHPTTVQKYLRKFGIRKSKQMIADLRKKTNIKKYGVENPSQRIEIKEKKKQTTLEHYAVENPFQSEAIKTKMKQTNLDKYGVENVGQSSEIREKMKQTTMERYGVEYATQSSQIKDKTKDTNMSKYGVENPMQSADVKNKMKQTMMERYGVENPSLSSDVRDKAKRTNLERFGVEYASQSEEIMNKIKNTNLERFGVEFFTLSDDFKDQLLSHLTQSQKENWIFATTSAENFKQICDANELKSTIDIAQYFGVGENAVRVHIRKFNLEKLYYSSESSLEIEIKQFLDSLNIKYEKTRSIINPLELDIYCPDYHLAIEMNGNYWHSSLCRDKEYHINKSKVCERKNIRLIHIYEYEWKNHDLQEKIKFLLKAIFGKVEYSIDANTCVVKQVSDADSELFNNNFNIHKYDKAQITYGLYYQNELVQLMSFSLDNNIGNNAWRIIQKCSKADYLIIGGLKTLFEYFLQNHNPESIFNYCDFNKFNGKDFEMLGMEFMGYTDPDMKWFMSDNSVQDEILPTQKETGDGILGQIWGAGAKKYLWRKNI